MNDHSELLKAARELIGRFDETITYGEAAFVLDKPYFESLALTARTLRTLVDIVEAHDKEKAINNHNVLGNTLVEDCQLSSVLLLLFRYHPL